MKPEIQRSTFSEAYGRIIRFLIGNGTERSSLRLCHRSGEQQNAHRQTDCDANIQGEILGIHSDWMPLLGRWY
jgi:hypothetical protein